MEQSNEDTVEEPLAQLKTLESEYRRGYRDAVDAANEVQRRRRDVSFESGYTEGIHTGRSEKGATGWWLVEMSEGHRNIRVMRDPHVDIGDAVFFSTIKGYTYDPDEALRWIREKL